MESLNVRGIREKRSKTDSWWYARYKVDIMGIQEHHLKGTVVVEIRSTDNKNTYELFYTGPNDINHHWVGIIVRKELTANYKE